MATAAVTAIVPTIIPSHVIGKNPPSDKIQIGQIGFGRIGKGLDTRAIMNNHNAARFIAVCDVDAKRLKDGKETLDRSYAEKTGKKKYMDTKMYGDYRELLLRSDIDAVVVSTPDHWHAQPAIEAALAGKDVFLQKPTTLTITEGKLLRATVEKMGTVFQVCTQHRCSEQFRTAAELVRNGRIGKLETVYIGIGGEKPGPAAKQQPIPTSLDYEMWIGSTPYVFYTEMGVHPQDGYGRPGWMRRHQFGAGGISNTGQHYIDVAAWGMDTERTSPVSIQAVGEFPKSGLYDVPKDFMVINEYENGLRSILSSAYPSGVKYVGDKGWISAGPGSMKVTASDPDKGIPSKVLDASDKSIFDSMIGENEIHLEHIDSLHGNWLDCIKSRRKTIVPVDVAHRSCSVALLGDIAMHVQRKLKYDPVKEVFIGDPEANNWLSRKQRRPYGTDYIYIPA